MSFVTLPYLGNILMKKFAGAGPVAIGNQRNVIAARGLPFNPDNNSYPGVVNASSYPSVRVKGRRTPSLRIQTVVKPYNPAGPAGFVDADFLNSLISVYGQPAFTDLWSLSFKDDRPVASGGERVWDWCRCSMLQLRQMAIGGPINMEWEMLARWGDNEGAQFYGNTAADGEVYPAAAPVFTYPTGADAGELSSVATTAFAGTLNEVRSWTLTLMRGQAYESYIDGTNFPKDIPSTMFSGVMTVEQSPRATQQIGNTGTATITINTDKSATTGKTQFNLVLVRDNKVLPQDTSFGNQTVTYTLVDLNVGGNPVAISAIA